MRTPRPHPRRFAPSNRNRGRQCALTAVEGEVRRLTSAAMRLMGERCGADTRPTQAGRRTTIETWLDKVCVCVCVPSVISLKRPPVKG